jgi:hypothetical protein
MQKLMLINYEDVVENGKQKESRLNQAVNQHLSDGWKVVHITSSTGIDNEIQGFVVMEKE